MRLKVDRENDAVYLRLDESPIVESEQVQPGVILDSDAEGKVIGLELPGMARRIPPTFFA
jgi:uncharacterized protein YuzE